MTPRVALVLVAVGDLSGSGGTERQFSDLFEYLQRTRPGRVTLITTAAAIRRLREAGRLTGVDDVVALPVGSASSRGLAGALFIAAALARVTLGRRWDIVHLCQPTPVYVPYAALITRLPRALRPRLTLTVVDCTLAHRWFAPASASDLYERQVVDAHRLYFKWARLDGIYSWYRAFTALARSASLVSARAVLVAAKYCFTDPRKFAPHAVKERIVIWAGRLSEQKRPLLFVDAVAELIRTAPDLAAAWRFEMYGRGPLEQQVTQRIAGHRLTGVVTLSHAPDLSERFARTRLFVSTQAFENFTSLSMLEAMAAGNVVVAENVGQTSEFVRGDNGVLVDAATPAAFAAAIAAYLRTPQDHDRMAQASRAVATEVHTIEHFADDIMAFWTAVANA